MSNHTPGPWYVIVHTGTDGKINPGSDWTIYAKGETYAITYEGGHNANAEHDARLIAAAPELLEALISAVDCGMVPISSAKEGGAVTNSIQVRVADQIRAAIAKATGETE